MPGSHAGRRDFGEFLEEYTAAIPGTFVDVDTGRALGSCPNLAAVTHGQGAGIGGLPDKCEQTLWCISSLQLMRPLVQARRAHPSCKGGFCALVAQQQLFASLACQHVIP